MDNLINSLFLTSVKNREKIITAFKFAYIVTFLFTIISVYLVLNNSPYSSDLFRLAKEAGEKAVGLYILTVIPGIFRRFGKQHKLVSLLMIYRRYIGILVFFVVLFHYMLERGVLIITHFSSLFTFSTFELMGMIAFFGLFFLTITSNDLSTSKMGIWWSRVHMLTYGILWFMFLHITLQEVSLWGLLLGITGIIQVLSFIYKKVKASK